MPTPRLLLGLAAMFALTACGQSALGPRPAGVRPAVAKRGAPAARDVPPPPSAPYNGPDLDEDGWIDRSEAMLRTYFFDDKADYTIRTRRARVLGFFAQADVDGDGRMPREDFTRALRDAPFKSYAIASIEIDIKLRDFGLADLDGDGALGRDELMATNQPPAMAWLEGDDRARLAHDVITAFDFDGDGALSRKEFAGTWCETFISEDLGDW